MSREYRSKICMEVFCLISYVLLLPILLARNLLSLPVSSVMNISMDIAGIAVVLILNADILGDRTPSGRGSLFFSYLLYIEFFALYTDILGWTIDGVPGFRWANILDNTVFYLCSVLIAYFYMLFVRDFLSLEDRKSKFFSQLGQIGCLLMILLLILNLFTGWVFVVDEANVYSRNILYPLTFLGPLCVFLVLPAFVVKDKNLKVRQKAALVSFCLAPILAAAVQTFTYGVSFLYILMLLSLLFVYFLIFIKRGEDLVETESAITEKEEHLDEQKQLILLSQVRPKYIQSALATISELCLTNSDEAYHLTNAFSDYLRHNLDAMSGAKVDSFLTELAHIERFAEVEEKRMGGRACIIYDIGPTEFQIPVLTVQPLVENAVYRSLLDDMEDIWVWVRTSEDDGHFYVTVENNSLTTTLEDLRDSEEIQSVRSRLESLSEAKLSYAVHEGNGCSIMITIPKN